MSAIVKSYRTDNEKLMAQFDRYLETRGCSIHTRRGCHGGLVRRFIYRLFAEAAQEAAALSVGAGGHQAD